MSVTQEDLEASLSRLRETVADPRAGILGPRSIAWHIGADLALFLGGGRAALLQLAHPHVAHAVDDHSRTRADVVGRFQRTFRNVFAMVFGDLDAAFAAARRVHAIHTRVHGTLPAAAGSWPAGTPYHANQIESLRWVHTTLVDTTIAVRELIDGPLPISIKDAYMIELHRFGALFGIPATELPASWSEHVAYVDSMIEGGCLAVVPCAYEMAGFLIGRHSPAIHVGRHSPAIHGRRGSQPMLGRTAELVTYALLPPRLAAEFGLRGAPRRTRAALAAFAAVYRRIPRAAVTIPACDEAQRRLDGRAPGKWSAWTERQLFGLARRTTGN
ncbi:MAG: DUF2236 domain-containing protein [Deltaproteobacteria bacterium]|nr:DUF2236 domain-containing protein [Deltaproteobacteria bacterium]